MNRRDMIIITVLLNVALLSALIALAVSDIEDHPSDAAATAVSAVQNRQSLPTSMASLPLAPPATVQAMRTASPSPAVEPSAIAFVPIGGEEELDNVLRGFHTNLPAVYMQEEVKKSSTTIDPPAISEGTRDSKEGFFEVTVKRGDVLERIARANHTTVAAIKQVNALKGERLVIGQVLRIPVSRDLEPTATAHQAAAVATSIAPIAYSSASSVAVSPEPSNKGSSDQDDAFYVVKNGDNPWKIARQFHVKFEDLLKLNGLDEERARNLRIGQRLRVR